MNTLQQEHDEQRKRYLNNEISHSEFYLWLADRIGVTEDDLPFTLDRIRKSNDPHLNDLPLHKWDMRDLRIRDKAYQAGMRSWSLSDTVCVLKNFARHMAA